MQPDEIAERFATYQRSLNRAASTIEWYGFLIRRFFAYAASKGVTELSDIDGRLLIEYQIHVSQSVRDDGRPYGVATQNLHMVVLRMLFRYLVRCGDMENNPAEDIELAKEPKRLPKGILSEQEVATILDGIETETPFGLRDRAMLETLYGTGIRRTELLRLDLSDINFDEGTILVREGKGKKDRYVAVTQVALHWLKTYIENARPKIETDRSGEAVFLSRKGGGRFGKQGIKGVVEHWVREAGIVKPVTPHCFRHSLATHLLNRGARLPFIQKQLGHARLETTSLYLHVAISELKKAHARYHPRGRVAA